MGIHLNSEYSIKIFSGVFVYDWGEKLEPPFSIAYFAFKLKLIMVSTKGKNSFGKLTKDGKLKSENIIKRRCSSLQEFFTRSDFRKLPWKQFNQWIELLRLQLSESSENAGSSVIFCKRPSLYRLWSALNLCLVDRLLEV